jgi:hypothetical protein
MNGAVVYWSIRDRTTGAPVTNACFQTRGQAEAKIAEWKKRQLAGGRPDISREHLATLEPYIWSSAYTWLTTYDE